MIEPRPRPPEPSRLMVLLGALGRGLRRVAGVLAVHLLVLAVLAVAIGIAGWLLTDQSLAMSLLGGVVIVLLMIVIGAVGAGV